MPAKHGVTDLLICILGLEGWAVDVFQEACLTGQWQIKRKSTGVQG
jgi:hypothetical protein